MTQRRISFLPTEELPSEFHIENYTQQEIISALHGMGLFVEEDDIKEPSCARVTFLFECLIDLITPWRANIIESERTNINISLHSLAGAEPGVSMDVLVVFDYLQSLLLDIKFTDVDLTDLTLPSPSRLLRILNALVNYARFSDLCWAVFEPLSTDLHQLNIRESESEHRVEELEHTIDNLKMQRKEEEPEVRKLQDMISDIDHEIQELRIQNESLTTEYEAAKTKRQQLKDILQEAQYLSIEEMELSNRYQKLAGYDVPYYKRLTLDAEKNLDIFESELNQCKALYSSLGIKLSQADMINKALKKTVDVLNNLTNTKNNYNRTKKTNESVEKDLANKEIETKRIDSEFLFAKRELATIEGNKKRLSEQQQKKRESMKLFWADAKKLDQEDVESKKNLSEAQQKKSKGEEFEFQANNLKLLQSNRQQIILDHLTKLKSQVEQKKIL